MAHFQQLRMLHPQLSTELPVTPCMPNADYIVLHVFQRQRLIVSVQIMLHLFHPHQADQM